VQNSVNSADTVTTAVTMTVPSDLLYSVHFHEANA